MWNSGFGFCLGVGGIGGVTMTVIVGSMVRTSMGCGVVAEMRHDGIICVNLRASNTNGVYQGYFTLDSVAPMGRTTAETVRLGYEKGQRMVIHFSTSMLRC